MERVLLGNILHMEKGRKPIKQIKESQIGFLPYVDIKAFERGIVDNYATTEKSLLCEDGDLLIVCDGSRSGLTGKAIKGVVGSTLAKISADGLSTEYLRYFIQSIYTLLNTQKKGTGTPHLNADLMKKAEIIVPPLPEQERIVARIEELFSQLDNGVETLKKTKQQLAVYRQAVLKEAFEGNWDYYKAKELCYFITKGTTPSKSEQLATGEIPFIKVYNLTFTTELDFSIEPTYVSRNVHRGLLSRSIVYPNDVLMNIVGPPMGKVSIVPNTYPEWNINQAIARFRCGEKLNNKFLAYYLGFSGTVEKMKSMAKATAGQFNLTLEICRNIEIPLPPIIEQCEIVAKIESKLSICDSIEQTIDTALQQAEALRQSILKKAFEGGDWLDVNMGKR